MKRLATIEKVAVYARVSTKDGRQDTENQLIALREYCAKQGWDIAGEYVDHETGGHSRRPHFQRMFADARARKFDLVLFWSLDRLSREGVSATLGHLERLTAAGVNWRSFTEEYLDSCGLFRDAVLSILATIAKQERVRRSERASAAVARLRRQGTTDHLGRKRKVLGAKLERVRELHVGGLSLRAIAAKVRVSPMTIQRALQSHLDEIPRLAAAIQEQGVATGSAYVKAQRIVNERPEIRDLCGAVDSAAKARLQVKERV